MLILTLSTPPMLSLQMVYSSAFLEQVATLVFQVEGCLPPLWPGCSPTLLTEEQWARWLGYASDYMGVAPEERSDFHLVMYELYRPSPPAPIPPASPRLEQIVQQKSTPCATVPSPTVEELRFALANGKMRVVGESLLSYICTRLYWAGRREVGDSEVYYQYRLKQRKANGKTLYTDYCAYTTNLRSEPMARKQFYHQLELVLECWYGVPLKRMERGRLVYWGVSLFPS
jgi:hypothetical protein